MAVAYARNVDPRILHWLRKYCKRNGMEKTSREFERAQTRHGHGIQLTAPELMKLHGADLPPKTRKLIDSMFDELKIAEADERANKDRARITTATARQIMEVDGDLRMKEVADAAYPRTVRLEGEGR